MENGQIIKYPPILTSDPNMVDFFQEAVQITVGNQDLNRNTKWESGKVGPELQAWLLTIVGMISETLEAIEIEQGIIDEELKSPVVDTDTVSLRRQNSDLKMQADIARTDQTALKLLAQYSSDFN